MVLASLARVRKGQPWMLVNKPDLHAFLDICGLLVICALVAEEDVSLRLFMVHFFSAYLTLERSNSDDVVGQPTVLCRFSAVDGMSMFSLLCITFSVICII